MKAKAALALGLALTVAGMISATSARAATPFTVAGGEHPRLAIDSRGTAHVAWTRAGLRPYRIPRGARACVGLRTFSLTPAGDVRRAARARSGRAWAHPRHPVLFRGVPQRHVVQAISS